MPGLVAAVAIPHLPPDPVCR
ncbi:MAG: hypothetical protein ACD_54C00367G0001, partial [uncultured bacterium]